MSFFQMAISVGLVLTALLVATLIMLGVNAEILQHIDLSDIILGGLILYLVIIAFYSGGARYLKKEHENYEISQIQAATPVAQTGTSLKEKYDVQHKVRNILNELLAASELLFEPHQRNDIFLALGHRFYRNVQKSILLVEKSYGTAISGALTDIKSHLESLKRQCTDTDITLLLIEDNPINLRVSEMLFYKAGCTRIYTANSGEDAIAKMQTMTAPVDLVVTDQVMPGMDGCRTAQAIYTYCSENTPDHIPVIVGLTGSFTHQLREQAASYHMKHIYSKPITLSKILEMVALCHTEEHDDIENAEDIAQQVMTDITGFAAGASFQEVSDIEKDMEAMLEELYALNLSTEQENYLEIIQHSSMELVELMKHFPNNAQLAA